MSLRRSTSRARRATVLLLVLWMLIVLGIIGLSYTSSVRNQLQSAQMTTGKAEAYWAARAGIEKAIGELLAADLTALTDADPLFDDPELFRDQAAGPARFSLIGRGVNEEGEGRSGLIDEASLINVNQADEQTLLLFPGMTLELARALFDWRDGDDLPRAYGAEFDTYEMTEDGVTPRNAPLQSVRELMRVVGWGDVYQTAYPDPYLAFKAKESDEAEAPVMTPDEARLLLESLTAWSMSPATDPAGAEKIDINSADARAMRRKGIRNSEADAIIEQRGKQRFQSLLDLLTVPPATASNSSSSSNSSSNSGNNSDSNRGGGGSGRGGGGGNRGGGGRNQSQSSSGSSSSAAADTPPSGRAFSVRRVGEIIDYFGTIQGTSNSNAETAQESPGLVNINTAPHEVLTALPGMTEELAAAIVQRRAQGAFDRPGAIAQLGIDEATFRRIYPKIAARSSRYRVVSRGVSPGSGAAVTIEAVLAANEEGVETVYWREY